MKENAIALIIQGRSQDFSKGGGGGHTVSNIIVMAFSPRNIVGCLLKNRLTKGGGGSRAPQGAPSPRPCNHLSNYTKTIILLRLFEYCRIIPPTSSRGLFDNIHFPFGE